ncbi:Glycosyltransferase involved in cell wall biosynthesis [uncultured Gammaproteobacteria bacterium]
MADGDRSRVIYLVTEDWYFWSHRLPMARAAQAAGFDVAVATRVAGHGQRIADQGFRVLPLSWRRRDHGPVATLRAIVEIAALYRRERPDVVHHVAMKPVIVGGLAVWLVSWLAKGANKGEECSPAVVAALTGLGFAFTAAGGALSRLRRFKGAALRALLGFLLSRPKVVAVVQNGDDQRLLLEAGLTTADRIMVIRGSGIDTDHFAPLPEPDNPVVIVAYVGRMLADKGLATLVEAHQRALAQGAKLRLHLIGDPDPENPTSISLDMLARWSRLPGIDIPGAVSDVRTVWATADIAVLPSLREGLPKSLLEAAACARPLIATDVPGCREIARHGENALLVPAEDPERLAQALVALAEDSELRRRFAASGRRLVLSDLSAPAVGAATVALYRQICRKNG